MLIHEVSNRTGLTKKAILYYEQQGLIAPSVLENGYRSYEASEIAILEQIGFFRKLDLSVEEIRGLLGKDYHETLQNILMKKELDLKRATLKRTILQKISEGEPYEHMLPEIEAMEKAKPIIEKFLEAFPGYYGRFVCLHFERFLNEPIQTKAQKEAYEKILSLLDDMPPLALPQDLKDYLMEGTQHIGVHEIEDIVARTQESIQNPDAFLTAHKEMLEQYLAYKESDEYRNSPAFRLKEAIQAFNEKSGYNDAFIPAMKILSPSYAAYYHQAEMANEKFLSAYPHALE